MEYKTIKDERFVSYLLIKGITEKNKTEVQGILCVTSEYVHNRIREKGTLYMCGVLVTDNGEIMIRPALKDVVVIAECTPNQIDMFTSTLHNANLAIKDYEFTKKGFLDELETLYRKTDIFIADTDKLHFKCGNKVVDRQGLLDMEIEKGKSIVLVYDNGYSYCSSDPVSKTDFLKSVDYVLAQPFILKSNCIEFTYDTTYKEFVVDVYISTDKRYSEVTNS